LVTEQYGFRKDLSPEDAAYLLTDGMLYAWNSKLHVAGIFCDQAEASDCINHEILIS
jgi:hypothetical protein